ncbi:MAG: hypothetical protein HUJ53_08165 [Holdemanella sp.]|nr:hypothetical protein [Holdemanella sp.]
MKKGLLLGFIALLAGITAYHLVHHEMYCKYQKVPGKSHCAKCSHRPICQKYHKKKWQKQ